MSAVATPGEWIGCTFVFFCFQYFHFPQWKCLSFIVMQKKSPQYIFERRKRMFPFGPILRWPEAPASLARFESLRVVGWEPAWELAGHCCPSLILNVISQRGNLTTRPSWRRAPHAVSPPPTPFIIFFVLVRLWRDLPAHLSPWWLLASWCRRPAPGEQGPCCPAPVTSIRRRGPREVLVVRDRRPALQPHAMGVDPKLHMMTARKFGNNFVRV